MTQHTGAFTSVHDDGISRLRVLLTRVVLAFLFVTTLIFFLINISTGDTSIVNMVLLVTCVGYAAAGAYADRQPVRNFIRAGTLLIIAGLMYIPLATQDNLVGLAALAMVSAALIGSRPIYYLVTALVVLRYGIFIYEQFPNSTPQDFLNNISLTLTPLMFGVLIRYVTSFLERQVNRSERSVQLLEASAGLGAEIAGIYNVEGLFNKTIEWIRQRFDYYHVQFYLVDESGHWLNLRASSGDIGRQLLRQTPRIEVDLHNFPGRVVLAKDVIVGSNTRQPTTRMNELLSNTRSEAGVPLLIDDEAVAVMDIHSVIPDSFSRAEIQALQVIASQVTAGLHNVRLFEQQEASLQEQKELLDASEKNRREIERLNRQLTGQFWSQYLAVNPSIRGIAFSGQGVESDIEWSETMRAASQTGHMIKHQDGDSAIISIPVTLRNQVIGAIEIETSDTSEESVAEIAEGVANRLALSLDNARLFEEAQTATAQEHHVSEIVSRFQSAQSVDDLLKMTLEGIYGTLGAERGSIRLQAFESDRVPDDSSNGSHLDEGEEA